MDNLIEYLKTNKQTVIKDLIKATIASLISNFFGQKNWLSLVVLFIIFFGSIQLYRKIFADLEKKRRIGIIVFALLLLLLGIFAIWDNILGPYTSSYFISKSDVRNLICGNHWVTYDPLSYNPFQSPNPDINSMDLDLEWIRNAGFDGVITFTSRDNFSAIPELARKHGLLVIMGIWNPNDKNEINIAISKRDYVSGYVVGHNGLNNPIAGNRSPYSEDDLIRVIRYVRYKTGLPVSTTELAKQYRADPFLFSIGDWAFPDAHIDLNIGDPDSYIEVEKAIKDTIEMAIIISSQEERGQKPILLKMVTFPHAGLIGSTQTSQAEFYMRLLDEKGSANTDLPGDVCISVHSAFDASWKTDPPFYKWDVFTGLIGESGKPNPAVQEIIKRRP